MKNKSSLHHLALFTSLVLPSSLQALEVHEWGTFTVLSSSQGNTVNWYQPFSDINQLPPFTYNPMAMKQGITAARVRMETPVIYFYPEEEMTVHARVAFRNGTITERFPAPSYTPYQSAGFLSIGLSQLHNNVSCVVKPPTSDQIFAQRLAEFSSAAAPTVTYWTGNLLAPDHEDAKLIPAVSGPAGEHYAAARAVPKAWLFRAATPNPLVAQQPNSQVEKFIFYRGAGQEVPPYYASMNNDKTVTLRSYSQSPSTFQVALRVRDGRASWKQMPNIAGPNGNNSRDSSISFSDETIPMEQADKELSALFLSELISRGLTKAEAEAMINTWNHTWFTEPGQRVFTFVDRTWVDSNLPLAISPEPKKMERVFVARYEILAPQTEQKLARILEQSPTPETARELTALELGRFANGAVEVIADQAKYKTMNHFHQLRDLKNRPTASVQTINKSE
jgi:hypothetical protein